MRRATKMTSPPVPVPDALTRPEDLWGPKPEPALQITPLADHETTKRGRGYPYLSVMGVFDVEAQVRDYMPAVRRNFDGSTTTLRNPRLSTRSGNNARAPGTIGPNGGWSISKSSRTCSSLPTASPRTSFQPTSLIAPSPVHFRLAGPGVWARTATHPRLENFVLSPEAIEREMNFYRAIINQRREALETQRRQKTGKRGIPQLHRGRPFSPPRFLRQPSRFSHLVRAMARK